MIIILGVVALTAGVFGQFGPWWGLIMAGTLSIAGAMLLIDVDEPKREESKR